MSKAIAEGTIGAVEIAAGVVLTVATDGAAASFGVSLIVAGVSTEIGVIAQELTSAPGMSETVRQPAAPRQIIYGTQRVGAVEIFESTTGSHKDQYNMVLVFASEVITAYENLYLDGRQVHWAGSGDGYVTRNGYGFGGGADGHDHTGPDGSTYNFANGISGHSGVFVVPFFGDQAAGAYCGELRANDPRWGPDAHGNTPYGGGLAYIYLKIEYQPSVFPGKPDIKATVKGKAVYDPRTGTTAYSDNWALIVADIIGDPDYGLDESAINEDQLIAAANICDEQVACAAGMESRYTCHYHYSTDTPVGQVLETVMAAAAGRISWIGGEWHIFPGTYTGPSASFGPDALIDRPTWSAQRSYRDKVNRVQGVFIAANYPYNVAGDYYDKNGWSPDGTVDNTFAMQFAPTNYPTYAADTLHGYASDQYLNEDGGVLLPKNLDLAAVLSISQAQRLAKIALQRNRQQGSGTLIMGPAGYGVQANDTFDMTFPSRGWANKLLEVVKTDFLIDRDASGMPMVKTVLSVQETAASVYEWSGSEELTVYDIPVNPTPAQNYTTAPPTNVTLLSGAGTALVGADGSVTPRLQVNWDTPEDVRVAHIQTQYRLTGASSWTDGGTVGADSNLMFLAPILAGQTYDVQIRSLRSNGAPSVWVQVNSFDTAVVLSVSVQDAIGPGSLIGEAYTDGTAAIECTAFTAVLGGKTVTYFPTTQWIFALAQQTMYYIYVVDPGLAGGNLTPVATKNKADYLGKLGYFLIGSKVTPYSAPVTGGGGGGGGTSSRYYPGSFHDMGTRTTINPLQAYDGNIDTFASVSGYTSPEEPTPTTASGQCLFQGFTATSPGDDSTLIVIAETEVDGGSVTCSISIAGTVSVVFTKASNTDTATYTYTIPGGTSFDDILVSVVATPGTLETGLDSTVKALVYEIYIEV